MKLDVQAEMEFEVPFFDVDSIHVVWHGHYFKYFELARTKLLQSLDYDIQDMKSSGYAWPVVECSCRYQRPLLYGQKVKLIAKLVDHEAFLKIAYEVRDIETGARCCRGHTVQAAIEIESGETCLYIPEVFQERLEKFREEHKQ